MVQKNDNLLEVSDLSTTYFTDEGEVNAVDGVSFEVGREEVFGIVGESGSGKSVTARSLIDIIQSPGEITGGKIWYRNQELAQILAGSYPEAVDGNRINIRELPPKITKVLRGKYFSMIFQDPKESFNKSYTIGEQVAEAVEVRKRIDENLDSLGDLKYSFWDFLRDSFSIRGGFVSDESYERAIELLELVDMPDPVSRAGEYPHQFSGGMLQRGMIAQAFACDPDLLIADEPTTALDVTIQSQILEKLAAIRSETGMSIVLITHNLGVIARTCDCIGVMYAGELVEKGGLTDIFERSVHPYTHGLLQSDPSTTATGERLEPMPGQVPDLIDQKMPTGCNFAERCPQAMDICAEDPPIYDVDEAHETKCYLADQEQHGDRKQQRRQ